MTIQWLINPEPFARRVNWEKIIPEREVIDLCWFGLRDEIYKEKDEERLYRLYQIKNDLQKLMAL